MKLQVEKRSRSQKAAEMLGAQVPEKNTFFDPETEISPEVWTRLDAFASQLLDGSAEAVVDAILYFKAKGEHVPLDSQLWLRKVQDFAKVIQTKVEEDLSFTDPSDSRYAPVTHGERIGRILMVDPSVRPYFHEVLEKMKSYYLPNKVLTYQGDRLRLMTWAGIFLYPEYRKIYEGLISRWVEDRIKDIKKLKGTWGDSTYALIKAAKDCLVAFDYIQTYRLAVQQAKDDIEQNNLSLLLAGKWHRYGHPEDIEPNLFSYFSPLLILSSKKIEIDGKGEVQIELPIKPMHLAHKLPERPLIV